MNAQIEVLHPTSTEIVELNQTAAGLAEIRRQLEGATFDCTTTEGDKAARETRRALVSLRTTLEAKRKELKAPHLNACQEIDAEAKRITGEIVALETPIDKQIKAEEARREAIRQERARQEAERIQAINDAIEKIRKRPLLYVSAPVDVVRGALRDTVAEDLAEFDETHKPRAEAAKDEAIDALTKILDERLEADRREREQAAERERLDAERAELARQREEQAAAQRKADAEAQAERDRLAAEQRAEQERQDAERRAQQRREDEERAARQKAEDEAREAERIRLAEAAAELERRQAEERAKAEAEAIETATLLEAAGAAIVLLTELGQGEHMVTRTLAHAFGVAIGEAMAKGGA